MAPPKNDPLSWALDGALLRDYGPRARRLPAAADRGAREDRARGYPTLGGGARTPKSGEEAGDGWVSCRREADGVRLRGRLRGGGGRDARRPAALWGGQEAPHRADAGARRDAPRLRPGLATRSLRARRSASRTSDLFNSGQELGG